MLSSRISRMLTKHRIPALCDCFTYPHAKQKELKKKRTRKNAFPQATMLTISIAIAPSAEGPWRILRGASEVSHKKKKSLSVVSCLLSVNMSLHLSMYWSRSLALSLSSLSLVPLSLSLARSRALSLSLFLVCLSLHVPIYSYLSLTRRLG